MLIEAPISYETVRDQLKTHLPEYLPLNPRATTKSILTELLMKKFGQKNESTGFTTLSPELLALCEGELGHRLAADLEIEKQQQAIVKAEDPVAMLKAEIVAIMNKELKTPSGPGPLIWLKSVFSHVHSYRTQKFTLIKEASSRMDTYNDNVSKKGDKLSKEMKKAILIECFNLSTLELNQDECQYINDFFIGKPQIFVPKSTILAKPAIPAQPAESDVSLETPTNNESTTTATTTATVTTTTTESVAPAVTVAKLVDVPAVIEPAPVVKPEPIAPVSTSATTTTAAATTTTTTTTAVTNEASKPAAPVAPTVAMASATTTSAAPTAAVTAATTTATTTTTTVVSSAQASTATKAPVKDPKAASAITKLPVTATVVLPPVTPAVIPTCAVISAPAVASIAPAVEETEMAKLSVRLKKYIYDKTTDAKGNPAKIHGATYGLRSDQHKKKAIAETLASDLATKSPIDQFVAIRKAIRDNRKATGPQLWSGELAKILTAMEKSVLKDLSPRDKAIAELKDYIAVAAETKQAERSPLYGLKSKQAVKLFEANKVIELFDAKSLKTDEEKLIDLHAAILANKKATVRSSPFYYGKLNEIFEDLKRSMPAPSEAPVAVVAEPKVTPALKATNGS